MPKRPKVGDIIEIPTSKGLAYAQYTHKNKEMGTLIRVLDGFFEKRPENMDDLAKKKHRFVTFFPLGAAVHRNIFEIVGHAEVPDEAKDFPLFRAAGLEDRDGTVRNWWLWDGEKSWQIGKLKPEQRKLPIEFIVTDVFLIEMIEEGWTPETDRETLESPP